MATTATAAASLDVGHRIIVPAHPWELDYLRAQPAIAALFDRGTIVDLGPMASPVTPTTSVRTVVQHRWPWQLKFSLHVRVTNSERVTLPKELDRAVEAARLAQTSVGIAAERVAPAFRCVHDPAYLTVVDDGQVIDGFSVLLRDNRWRANGTWGSADVSALTTLCQDHPFGGPSRLGRIVERIAARDGRPVHDVGREWFARFCDVAVVSLVRLYLDLGLCFEPHQQNTLLELDPSGWPERAIYRDSQGYFHREAAHADMCAVIPGLGEATESIFPEALADERLVYYPFLNLTLGVVNALGAAGCADEAVLLGDLRRVLEAERNRGGRYPGTLIDRLLDDERWPCKGNLRTRFHDMDELVGDIETQSVYVTVPNPLWDVR
jgi:siderophore synthetase component